MELGNVGWVIERVEESSRTGKYKASTEGRKILDFLFPRKLTEIKPGLPAQSSLKKGVFRVWCDDSKRGLAPYVSAREE